MAISDIVAVSISVQDSSPTAPAFDTPVVMAKAPFVGDRLYNATPAGLAAMVTDGFATYDRAYQIASAMASQSGGVGQFYVSARTSTSASVKRLTVDITKTAVGETLSFSYSYQGVSAAISHTIVTNTVDAILDAFETAMTGSAVETAGAATAPDGATATYLEVTGDVAGDVILFDLGDESALELTDVTAASSTTLADQLSAMKGRLGEAVYGLLIDTHVESELNAAATFAAANKMVFVGNSSDAAILDSGDSTDVASDIQGATNNKAGVFFTRNESGDVAAAMMSLGLGFTAGSATWAFKTLSGVTADTMSATDASTALGKGASLYVRDRGVNHTDRVGATGGGRYWDLVHGIDFLQADIETRMYQLLLNQDKIPFNAAGLAQVEGTLRGALSASVASGLIEPDFQITMPSLVGYSTVDKAARILRTVTFSATLTGAIHTITVAGTLTL